MENLRRKTQKCSFSLCFSVSLFCFRKNKWGKFAKKKEKRQKMKNFLLSNVYYYFFYVIVFVLENYFFTKTGSMQEWYHEGDSFITKSSDIIVTIIHKNQFKTGFNIKGTKKRCNRDSSFPQTSYLASFYNKFSFTYHSTVQRSTSQPLHNYSTKIIPLPYKEVIVQGNQIKRTKKLTSDNTDRFFYLISI